MVDFLNATFYSVCILPSAGLGPALADTLTVYHATHNNIIAAGLLSNATLADGLGKMMVQTGLDALKINVMPSTLLVSPASYVLARTLVAQIMPNQASQVNPFAGQLEVIADANLSGPRYYLLAAPGRLAQYVYGHLDDVPFRVDTRAGWEIEGVEVRLVTDFAVGAVASNARASGAGV